MQISYIKRLNFLNLNISTTLKVILKYFEQSGGSIALGSVKKRVYCVRFRHYKKLETTALS